MPVESIARPLRDPASKCLFPEMEEAAPAKQPYPFFEEDSEYLPGTSIRRTEDFLLPNDSFRHEDFMALEPKECPETQEDAPTTPPEVEFKTPPPRGKHLEDSQCLASIASNHSQYDMSPSLPAGSKDHKVEESKDSCYYSCLAPSKCHNHWGDKGLFFKGERVGLQEPSESAGVPDLPDNASVDGLGNPEKKAGLQTVTWSCFRCMVLGPYCFFQMGGSPLMISDDSW